MKIQTSCEAYFLTSCDLLWLPMIIVIKFTYLVLFLIDIWIYMQRDAILCMYFPLNFKIDILCINWTSVVIRCHYWSSSCKWRFSLIKPFWELLGMAKDTIFGIYTHFMEKTGIVTRGRSEWGVEANKIFFQLIKIIIRKVTVWFW